MNKDISKVITGLASPGHMSPKIWSSPLEKTTATLALLCVITATGFPSERNIQVPWDQASTPATPVLLPGWDTASGFAPQLVAGPAKEKTSSALPSSVIGGVDFSPYLGQYALAKGKLINGNQACPAELSVEADSQRLSAISPDGARYWNSIAPGFRTTGMISWPMGEFFENINGDVQRHGEVWQTGLGRSQRSSQTTADKINERIVLRKENHYADTYVRGSSRKTILTFDQSKLHLEYYDSDTGRPLETGFWQSLNVTGKKLDIDLDCSYTRNP